MLRPDPTIWDGSFSNNGWLQELPKPQSKMTWDNAIWISPATAQQRNLTTGNMAELKYQGRSVTGPVWIMPGHANDSVTVHLGFGRTYAGHVGNEVGFNAYLLRTSAEPDGGYGLELNKAGGSHEFATTQHTQTMEEGEPIRIATLEEYKKTPQFADQEELQKPLPPKLTLYPDYRYEGYKWGMTIDLNACVGCGSCMTACQAENNIAVVGKIEVARGRHMNWLRVDRYFKGNWDNPELYFQPVPCMQCENAPCELVCPVAATVHSGDGLNQMVYNRCVGTRYCSNNCPYKVRRFNFFLYSDWGTPSEYGMRNPNVTVRSRGVMEKCTYCIQRISAAKIESEKQNRRIADGEITPACAQACPTQAIVFGDINDPKSRLAGLKAQARNYSLLEDLNVRPRTTYLGRLRNPNPEIGNA
jgi:molybdopterin-containing oxidoreductase family iron-sulfur binding subunit